MTILDQVRSVRDEVLSCYESLHQIPELGFEEMETSAFIAAKLRQYGLESIRTGVAQTGVVADLRVKGGPGTKTLMLRADIDALPLDECTGLSFASKHPGKAHSCGHDAHMSMLLGAAKYLSSHRELLHGSLRFVFQPAEEGPVPGGAFRMIEEGVLEGVDACLVMHVSPLFPTGTVMVQNREAMAATDKFHIEIVGKGGHGAMPQSAIDPIPPLAELLAAINQLPSRELDPLDPCVITVGTVNTVSSAWNVIPGKVEIAGTFRTFSPETRTLVARRLGELSQGICAAHRCSGTFTRVEGWQSTINDEGMVSFALETAARLLGEGKAIRQAAPFMTGEDAGAYFRKVPGALIWLGCSPEGAIDPPNLHNPAFKPDTAALAIGVAVHVNNALAFLG